MVLVPDDVVAVVCDQLIPGQRRIDPRENHRGGREHDGVQAEGRHEGRGRLRLRLLVARARCLVDGSAVADVVVGTQADHVLAVGL